MPSGHNRIHENVVMINRRFFSPATNGTNYCIELSLHILATSLHANYSTHTYTHVVGGWQLVRKHDTITNTMNKLLI